MKLISLCLLLSAFAMEIDPHVPFSFLPSCILLKEVFFLLDPVDIVHLGRVNTHMAQIAGEALNLRFKKAKDGKRVWDVEKLYDVHQSPDCQSREDLERCIRKYMTRPIEDIRLWSTLERYVFPTLFHSRLPYSTIFNYPVSGEIVRMVYKYRRYVSVAFISSRIHLTAELIDYALPLMGEIDYDLDVLAPGLMARIFCKIETPSMLLTYLHDNKMWSVDRVANYQVDPLSMLYCLNMATDDNIPAIEELLRKGAGLVKYEAGTLILNNYNTKALVCLLSQPGLFTEIERRCLILKSLKHPDYLELYEAIRGKKYLAYVGQCIENVTKKCRVRPAKQLEVALVYGLPEDTCFEIIEKPAMKHNEHLFLIAAMRGYSSDFLRELLRTPGPEKYRSSLYLDGSMSVFPGTFDPSILLDVLLKSANVYGEVFVSWTDKLSLLNHFENGEANMNGFVRLLNESFEQGRFPTLSTAIIGGLIRSVESPKNLPVLAMICELVFKHDDHIDLPHLSSDVMDYIYDFTMDYSLEELIEKSGIGSQMIWSTRVVPLMNSQVGICRMIMKRPGGLEALFAATGDRPRMYLMAIAHGPDDLSFDWADMVRSFTPVRSSMPLNLTVCYCFFQFKNKMMPFFDYLIAHFDDSNEARSILSTFIHYSIK